MNACEAAISEGNKARANLREIAGLLRDANLKKGEFETTEQFKTRAMAFLSKSKSGASGSLLFELPVPEDKVAYNADTGILLVGREYSGLLASATSGSSRLLVSQATRDAGEYVGENAFGAKRSVTRMQQLQLIVDVSEGRYTSSGWPEGIKPISLTMNSGDAKAAKGALAVIFQGELRAPFYEVERTRSTPRIDAPVDLTRVSEVLYVDPSCAVLYNRKTGASIQDLPMRTRF